MGRCIRYISCLLTHVSQTVCGMGVVGSDWEKLKRFNLAELYQPAKRSPVDKAEASSETVTTDEARPADAAPLAKSTDSLVTRKNGLRK
jgi:tRNA acetyltransferase TAN1